MPPWESLHEIHVGAAQFNSIQFDSIQLNSIHSIRVLLVVVLAEYVDCASASMECVSNRFTFVRVLLDIVLAEYVD